MPLTVYLKGEGPANTDVIKDIEAYFRLATNLTSEYARVVLSEIEQSTPSQDGTGFIDRFRHFLYWSELSTGCKAALLVGSTPKCVDVSECGFNAVQAILRYATAGAIVMHYTERTFTGACDLTIHGKHYTQLSDFVYHLREEVL